MGPIDAEIETLRRRHSIRLANWDYSREGAYFVTLCTYKREEIFGRVEGDIVSLSAIGRIVATEWTDSFTSRPAFEPDQFVVMPNHFHAIVMITDSVGATCGRPKRIEIESLHVRRSGPTRASLGAMMAGFKASVTSRCKAVIGMKQLQVWQRNYYDHIIRNESDLRACRQYIIDNPRKWGLDRYYPKS